MQRSQLRGQQPRSSNPLLQENVKNAVAAYEAAGVSAPVPIDLVTSDFTGFDPDISEAAALAQVNMVASARNLDPTKLHNLVESEVQGRILWVFGEPVVNVLQLNIALDAQQSASPAEAFAGKRFASIISRMSNATAAGTVQAPAATVPRGHLRVFLGATPGSGKTSPCSVRPMIAAPRARTSWSASSRRTGES